VEAVVAVWATHPWLGGDSPVYLALAQNLEQGCFGVLKAGVCQPDALRPPGYPLILALEIFGLRLSLGAIALFQSALYLASLRLMEALLRRLGISPLPLLAAALIYPFAAIYSAYIMTEAWAMLALSLIAFLICTERVQFLTAAIIGLTAGAAALIRSDLLLLPVLLAVLVALNLSNRSGRMQGLGRAGLVLLGASMILLPYAAWNYEHFGKPPPAPVASAVGNTLYLAVWQSRLSHDDLDPLYKGVVTEPVRASGLVPEMERLNRSIDAPPLTVPFNPADYQDQRAQIRSTQVFGRAAVGRIEADPAGYLRHVAANIWLLWNTSIYPANLPKAAQLALRLVSALVFIAGVLGLFIALASSRRRHFIPIAALLVYLPAIHIWLHTEARYTAAARPILLLFVSVFACFAWDRFQARDGEPASAAA
jgi:hypothetical protein